MCPPTIEPVDDRNEDGASRLTGADALEDAGTGAFPEIRGYTIECVLGEGAVGTVYRGRRRDTGVIVALKVLNVIGPKRRKHITRLAKEGRVMARLNHPGIVKGLDVGESEGHYFIAMEFVDGSSVRDLLDAGRIFTESEALDFAVPVIKALHHAATQGVVHRDVKPANLMITRDGKVKVADLGLAKDAIDLSLTRSDATVGTPQYIAPEQARDSQSVDLRSDIFSFGATLYHMVCGTPPFSGGSLAEIITRVLHDDERPVEQLNPALSRPFSKLLSRMLAKSPDDRYQNYVGLLADVERVRAGRDIEGLPARGRPAGLSRLQWGFVGLGLLALVTVFVVRPWRGDPKLPPVTPDAKTAKVAPVAPTVPTPSARWRPGLVKLGQRLKELVDAGDHGSALELIEGERPIYPSGAAHTAFGELEKKTQRQIHRRLRRVFDERLEKLRTGTHEVLAGQLGPTAFAGIRDRLASFKRALNELPAFLDRSFFADFEEGVAEIRVQARTKSQELCASGLRLAREDADAFRFVSAEARLEQLKRWAVDVYYSESRIEIEKMNSLIASRRVQARADYQTEYDRFWNDFQSAMAELDYAEADRMGEDFAARVNAWQKEAPRESATIANLVARDRGDFQGVVKLWERAVERLRQFRRTRTAVRVSFGSESSKKMIRGVDARGEYPDKVKIQFEVGGRRLENVASKLRPGDVVMLARTLVDRKPLEPRSVALYYYFVSRGPGLSSARALELLDQSAAAFAEVGRDAGRYKPRIAAWRAVQNQDRAEREENAKTLHEEAIALYKTWAFKKAADKWNRLKALYPITYKRMAPLYDAWRTRADKAEPLAQLAKRFPGAKRTHRDDVHPLAFKLRWVFDAQTDASGIEYAWEIWRLTMDGFKREVNADERHKGPNEKVPFPATWGIRVPIALNLARDARLRIKLATDSKQLMALFCVSLGGHIAGICNLDGIRNKAGIPRRYYNQHSLWTSKDDSKTRPDVFRGFAREFLMTAVGGDAPSGVRTSFRFGVAREHVLELRVTKRRRRFSLWADGEERHFISRDLRPRRRWDEIEIRCWSSPILIKEIEIEGILNR